MGIMFEEGYPSFKPKSLREARTCEWCGKEYMPKTANQKTCSKECSYLRDITKKREHGRIHWKEYKRKEKPKTDSEHVGRHFRSKDERREAVIDKIKRKQNMEELIRIANLSNGDYGKWVSENDFGRAEE